MDEREAGFSLIETLIGTAVLLVVGGVALQALSAGAHVQTAEVPRETVMLAARNLAVDARAALAFDAGAGAAATAAGAQTWAGAGNLRFAAAGSGGVLDLSATGGPYVARIRWPIVREALPQGACVDAAGRPASC